MEIWIEKFSQQMERIVDMYLLPRGVFEIMGKAPIIEQLSKTPKKSL